MISGETILMFTNHKIRSLLAKSYPADGYQKVLILDILPNSRRNMEVTSFWDLPVKKFGHRLSFVCSNVQYKKVFQYRVSKSIFGFFSKAKLEGTHYTFRHSLLFPSCNPMEIGQSQLCCIPVHIPVLWKGQQSLRNFVENKKL